MTANLQTPGVITNGSDSMNNNNLQTRIVGTDFSYKHKLVWTNAIFFTILFSLGFWGIYLLLIGDVQFKSALWTVVCVFLGGEGITIGAHRFYTHKSFKATPLIRAVLIILQTTAGQNSMFTWCRDHRLHHRYVDTDGDPHNSKRGFFFSHIGWLMHKKHPYVIELGKKVDMSDLEADWMVMIQKKNLQPLENWFVSAITSGEGWHNYHHAFPWDYKAAELSDHFNFSAQIIEFFAKIGMVYDLKIASPDMVTRAFAFEKYHFGEVELMMKTIDDHRNYSIVNELRLKMYHLLSEHSSRRFKRAQARWGCMVLLQSPSGLLQQSTRQEDSNESKLDGVNNRIKRTGDGTHRELGDEESKAAVKAFGPLHPLNPTYTVTYKEPDASVKVEDLSLYQENDILDFSNTTITKNVGLNLKQG